MSDETDVRPRLTGAANERPQVLTFRDYKSEDAYVGRFVVDFSADGMSASVPVIVSAGGDQLVEFLESLAEDFRGWTGARHWRALENQLAIEATWQSGGHVLMKVTIRPHFGDQWAVTAHFVIDAGSSLQRLASDFATFFRD